MSKSSINHHSLIIRQVTALDLVEVCAVSALLIIIIIIQCWANPNRDWDLNRDFSVFLRMIEQFLGVIRHERLGFDLVRYFL